MHTDPIVSAFTTITWVDTDYGDPFLGSDTLLTGGLGVSVKYFIFLPYSTAFLRSVAFSWDFSSTLT
jgi:hypothetical protein